MDGEARLQITLLGEFRVSRGGVVLSLPGVRLRSLLVRLALAGGRTVEPATLVDTIWAEDELPAAASAALQALVSRLRRVLGASALTGGYRLVVDGSDVDALRFEELASAGRRSLRAGDPAAAAGKLAEAAALWGDRIGAEPAVIAAVAPAVAARLAQESTEVICDLAEAEQATGRWEPAIARLTGLIAGQPVNERAAALLLDALAKAGRQADALAVYERIRQAFADAFGADPGAALRERHRRLLQPKQAPEPGPAGLPAPVTGFVGRDWELRRTAVLFGSHRLVTVVGPGGVGKTRLAVQAARRSPVAALMVDLSAVTEPAEVAAAVVAGLGLRGGPLIDGGRNDREVLLAEFGGRELMLLLDNCEHLIDAVARLVSDLLPRCPRLWVLATSREPLAIDGEALVPLDPLPLPEPGDGVVEARQRDSVRLFVDRASAVRPDLAVDPLTLPLIVEVVRGLDGLPLALELAAARLRTMSLAELAAGLADRFRLLTAGRRTGPARHRTLRAVITWSWDLLDDRERVVAERISVLSGGITRASATAVCAGTGVPARDVPDLLAALVDRSLLQLAPGGGRYRMLETIREYGLARTGDRETAHDLAADYFGVLLERADAQLRGPGQMTAMSAIGTEYDNTIAALRHRCDTGDSPGAVALARDLTWYWQMSGRQSDGVHWLGAALAVPGRVPGPDRDRVRAAYLLTRPDGHRAEMRELGGRLRGELFGAILLFLVEPSEAVPVLEGLGDGDDVWLSGLAHMFLAEIAENTGDLTRMRADLEKSLAGFRRAGDRWGRAGTLPMRAHLRRYDDLDGALADLTEARTLAAGFGTLSVEDQLHSDLRWIDLHLRRGDRDQALALIAESRTRAPAALTPLLDVQEARCDPARAGTLLSRAGSTPTPLAAAAMWAMLCLTANDRPGAENLLRSGHAAALTTGELPLLAMAAVGAASLADADGRFEDSAHLLGLAARLRGTHDHTDPLVRTLTGRMAEPGYKEGFNLNPATAATVLAGVIASCSSQDSGSGGKTPDLPIDRAIDSGHGGTTGVQTGVAVERETAPPDAAPVFPVDRSHCG